MRLRNQPGNWLRRYPFRVYLAAVAFAVVPLSFFLLTAHNLLLQQSTTRLVTQAALSGKLIGAQLERHMHASELFLESLALRPDLLGDWQAEHYEALSQKLHQVHTLRPELTSLGIYDLNGTLRAISPPSPESLNQNFAARDWYSGVRNGWQPYVSSAYPTASLPTRDVVAIAVPLHDTRGKPVAILVARETLDAATDEIYGGTTAVNRGLIFFVDRKGQVFGERNDHVQILPDLQPMREAMGRPSQTKSQRVALNGREYVLAYAPISSLQWAVLIQVPGDLIRRTLWDYEQGLAVLGLLIILLTLGSGAAVAYLYEKLRRSEDRYLHQIETQNRALELRRREAEHASQMKSRFLATMSHELRTPLNAILGFATLLQDEPALGETQKRWLEHIHQGGQHLLKLVNDVLDLSRIEAGRVELHPETFLADRAVPEIVATLAPLIAAKQIKLRVEVEDKLRVVADRVRFKQILYNLLSNAVKFTPPEGEVRLRGQRDGGQAVFEVKDTGIGIRRDDQEKVFQEFGRLQDDTEGTGLGLAITQRLIRQHGGELAVESEIGKGSTFRFTLPLPQDSSEEIDAVAENGRER